jgi:hypothetical protein
VTTEAGWKKVFRFWPVELEDGTRSGFFCELERRWLEINSGSYGGAFEGDQNRWSYRRVPGYDK